MPQLIIKWGPQEHRFTISSPQISIGRSDKNMIQLKDDKISRYHFQIVQTPSGYLLSDFGSSNATFVNGQRIERKVLQNNDIIKIGDITIIFLAGSPVLLAQSETYQKQLKPLVITNPSSSAKPVLSENATVIITNMNKNIVPQTNKNLSPSRQPVNTLNSQQKPLTTPHSSINQVKKKESSQVKVNTTPSKPNVIYADKKIIVSQSASTKIASTISRTQTPIPASSKITTFPPSKKPSTLIKHKSTTSIAKLMPQKIQEYNSQEQEMEIKPQPNKNKKYYIIGGVVVVIVLLIIILAKHSGSVKKESEENTKQNQLIEEAKGLYESKKFTEAVKKYKECLTEFPNSQYRDKIKESIEKIESLIAKEKESKTKLDELINKKKKCAVKDYPELLNEFQTFIKDYNTTAFALTAKNEMESIKRLAESEESERESRRVEAVEAEAKTLFDKKEYDAAINKLQEFLDKNPSLNNRLKSRIKKSIADLKKEKDGNSEKK